LLHGRQDMFVPFGHGEWLAAHIPGVEARLLDDDGHLTLLQNRTRGACLAVRTPIARQ
jgi:pimeloyl-ACP methyl ester carboxylesterase